MGFFTKDEKIIRIEHFIKNVSEAYKKYDEIIIKKKQHDLKTVDFFLKKFIEIKKETQSIITEMVLMNDKSLKSSIKKLESTSKELQTSIEALEKAITLLELEKENSKGFIDDKK